MEKKKPKFVRRKSKSLSKLGRKRKNKQVWRKPKGRDNKMREKRKGYPAVVKIGYKKAEQKSQIIINNVKDLEKVGKEDLIIIGKVGKKKKIEIVEKAKEKGIKINLNIKNFLEKNKMAPKGVPSVKGDINTEGKDSKDKKQEEKK